MEMDKNSNNETSRQEDDFDLDQLISDFSGSDGDSRDDESLRPLPIAELLDDVNSVTCDERVTELDEESGSDYATLAREFVNLDLDDIDEDSNEAGPLSTDNVIDLDDTIDTGAEEDGVHIDLDLSDITANTSEFEALQSPDDDTSITGPHIAMAGEMDDQSDEFVSDIPTHGKSVQAVPGSETLDVETCGVGLDDSSGNERITLEGSLEEIELEEYSSPADTSAVESSFGMEPESGSDNGIIDLDLDFGDDEDIVGSETSVEVREEEDVEESDFLGLSSLSLVSSGVGNDTEVMFSGVEMDFDDQINTVTSAEIYLAMGKKDEAIALFRDVSSKKGETNWVAKRLRMLATSH